jgi:hypothetical protein
MNSSSVTRVRFRRRSDFAMSQPPIEPPQHVVRKRTVSQWAVLLGVWGAGLIVWSIYIIAIVYLFFKFIV